MILAFLAAASVAAPRAVSGARFLPIALTHADQPLIERVLAESRVERLPSRPAWGSYWEAWAEAVRRWVLDFLERRPGLFGSVWVGLRAAALLAVAAAIALLLVVLGRRLLRRRRRARSKWEGTGLAGAAPAAATERDAADWRREIDERLARGDVAGSIEALWWWFARSIAPGSIDSSWTTRELVRTVRRLDLLPQVAVLDSLMYGLRRPSARDIAGSVARIEEAVG